MKRVFSSWNLAAVHHARNVLDVAGIRAGEAGLSFGQVTNNLRVENPGKKG